MSTDLVQVTPSTERAPPTIASTDDVVAAWLEGRNPRTGRAYALDVADFARFAGAPTPAAAVDALIRYDDNRDDVAGRLAQQLGDDD